MKILKIVIIILVVIAGIILIPPLFMDSELNVERTRVLKAQPEAIWDQVNCLENWEKWDMWHKDTNMTGHYEGPECGVGAKNIWTYKNTEDGGSQTITEVREFEYIKTFLDFQKMGTADAEMFFERVDGGTKVTWTLVSKAPSLIMRWVNTLMVGPGVTESYDQGLENLDELTKDMKPAPKYATGAISITMVESMDALAVRSVVGMDGIAEAMGQAFGKIMPLAGNKMAGAPFAIWYQWEGETFEFDNCIAVSSPVAGSGDVKSIKTYGGKAVMATHTGAYETTNYTWEAIGAYLAENGLQSTANPYEVYLTDPGQEPDPSKWVTELYWPIK